MFIAVHLQELFLLGIIDWLCSAIEVSYIIKEGYKFAKDKTIYPIPEFSYGHKEDFNINILKLYDYE